MNENKPSTSFIEADLGTFEFLGEHDIFTPDHNLLIALGEGRDFNDEDKGVYDEICDTLSKEGQLPFHWSQQESHFLKSHPRDTWLEYIIYRFKFRLYPKRQIVPDFPVYLLIEPTSVCNLRCKMCFQVDKSFTKKPFMGNMKYDLFCRLIDEAVEGGTKALTMASRGEPLLNKDIGRMIHYASNKFLEFKLITNATHLTEELCHEILSSNVSLLTFSVDAHTKEVYEDIRVKGKFEVVRDNIQRFHDIRIKDYPDSKIITRVSGVKVQDNQDPEGFSNFWSSMADEVGMKAAYERWDTYSNEPLEDFTTPCSYVWERLYVWYDGETNICDADYKTYLKPGNMSDSSIRDVWHGEKLKQLREDHSQGRRNLHNPCDRCGIS